MTDLPSSLRQLEVADLPLILSWRNSPAVRQFMHNSHLITAEEHLAWFARASRDTDRHLLVLDMGGTPTGYMSLSKSGDDTYEWGFYLAPDSVRGSGRVLGLQGLEYAFEKLSASWVIGGVLMRNERSIRFHERFGFVPVAEVNMLLSPPSLPETVWYALPRERWETLRSMT
jgi:UDP-4-amino-4,6-dideoxy-N-acetyl-beta-L-altrosamine N-acetyltransferase